MTVNTVNITSGPYIGNGASDEYSYTFRVKDKTQLSVYETTDLGVQTLLVVDTDYTVNNVGVDAGGTVTRLAGNLPANYTWYIRSNYIENQLTAFASQGGFFPDVHENQMDHLTFLIQQQLDFINRSFRLSDSIDIDGAFTLNQDAAARASQFIAFDGAGNLVLSSGTGADAGLRADLASTVVDTGANGFNLVSVPPISGETGIENHAFARGYVLRYIPWSLHEGIRDGTNAVDLTTYIQNGLDSLSGTGGDFDLGFGTFLISATLAVHGRGVHVRGDGADACKIKANHATGAAIRLHDVYQKLSRVSIISGTTRAAATNITGFGVHLEALDVVPNSSTLAGYMYNSNVSDVVISDQPSNGMYVVGPTINGSTFDRLRVFSNRGHGILTDAGTFSGRTNIGVATGLFNINHCNIFGNSGNGIALGNPNQSTTTKSIRIQVNNCDVGNNATDAAVRFDAHQIWASGVGHIIENSYTSDSLSNTVGIYIEGRNNSIRQLRCNNVLYAVDVGNNSLLPTTGIYVENINVIGSVTHDPAVVVNANASNVHVESMNMENINTLVSGSTRGLSVGNKDISFKKTSDQTVNNSTTLVGIEQLAYYAADYEEGYFELVIEHTSSVTTGLKIGFTAPASQFRFHTVDGRITDPTGTIVDSYVNTSASSTIETYSDTNRRLITIKGFYRITSTGGLIQPMFAQSTAVAGDTDVKTPTTKFTLNKLTAL